MVKHPSDHEVAYHHNQSSIDENHSAMQSYVHALDMLTSGPIPNAETG